MVDEAFVTEQLESIDMFVILDELAAILDGAGMQDFDTFTLDGVPLRLCFLGGGEEGGFVVGESFLKSLAIFISATMEDFITIGLNVGVGFQSSP